MELSDFNVVLFTYWYEVVAQWKSNSIFLYNSTAHCFLHDCICYTQVRFIECLQKGLALHFIICLLRNSSAEVNTTVMWWCILPYKTCNLESWKFGWECWKSFIVFWYKRCFSKPALAALDTHTLCVTFTTHYCSHMTENSNIRPQECYQWQLSFHYKLHPLIRIYSWC
jgi:hypothetical protein